jgi:sec-independent protein translocase protein TatA
VTGALSPSHWVIILVVLLLLFGAKRLPDAARGVGRSLRIFKAETAAMSEDATPAVPAATPAATPTVTPVDPPARSTNGSTAAPRA